MPNAFFARLAASLLLSLMTLPVWAQPAAGAPLKVEAAWIRASVPGQAGTGAFMRLTAAEPLTLVGVSTPVNKLISVVLPAPLGPITAVTEPGAMENDTSVKALRP